MHNAFSHRGHLSDGAPSNIKHRLHHGAFECEVANGCEPDPELAPTISEFRFAPVWAAPRGQELEDHLVLTEHVDGAERFPQTIRPSEFWVEDMVKTRLDDRKACSVAGTLAVADGDTATSSSSSDSESEVCKWQCL